MWQNSMLIQADSASIFTEKTDKKNAFYCNIELLQHV